MDPAHTSSSPESSSGKDRADVAAAARGSLCYGSFGDPTSHVGPSFQAAGVAALTSQVQQLMAAFTAVTAAASPPSALASAPAPVPVPAPAPAPAGGLPRSVHHELLHPLRSAASDVFASEEAKVAFAINHHLTGRARLWGTAEWERRTPACASFQAFITELRLKVLANQPRLGPDATRGTAEY
ncbi:hypothetical protein L3Q82_002985 [Scortum barcoo]|uniref:Uncharacterized protein n=1 Tax=Scortum barcoo TaxID=214431 RepID=A0ACB8VRW3_9TELE|nr:hypothetical protein L3Q82_002985 [Scortum barcoo]